MGALNRVGNGARRTWNTFVGLFWTAGGVVAVATAPALTKLVGLLALGYGLYCLYLAFAPRSHLEGDLVSDEYPRAEARSFDATSAAPSSPTASAVVGKPPPASQAPPQLDSQKLAGWYSDAERRCDYRWWDGGSWTAAVSRQGQVGLDRDFVDRSDWAQSEDPQIPSAPVAGSTFCSKCGLARSRAAAFCRGCGASST